MSSARPRPNYWRGAPALDERQANATALTLVGPRSCELSAEPARPSAVTPGFWMVPYRVYTRSVTSTLRGSGGLAADWSQRPRRPWQRQAARLWRTDGSSVRSVGVGSVASAPLFHRDGQRASGPSATDPGRRLGRFQDAGDVLVARTFHNSQQPCRDGARQFAELSWPQSRGREPGQVANGPTTLWGVGR